MWIHRRPLGRQWRQRWSYCGVMSQGTQGTGQTSHAQVCERAREAMELQRRKWGIYEMKRCGQKSMSPNTLLGQLRRQTFFVHYWFDRPSI
jgi:hypothetical protein